jgi:hypothetical protein
MSSAARTTLVLATALAATALAASARADLTLFLGPEGGVGDVVVFDESALLPPAPVTGLSGVQLLGLDAVGRTRLETFLPGRPQQREVVPGVTRVELPDGRGSVYRFRRAGAGTSAAFGLFHVDGSGRARVLVERPGTGVLGDTDPFLARIAVAPAGDSILVATLVEAGGDALEIDLVSGAIVDRTASVPPLDVATSGLGLRADWGLVVAADGPRRFDRTPGSGAVPVALPGAPTWFGGELVFSEDGLVAATIAGTDPTASHPFVLRASGPALRLDDTPRHLSPAGFLPRDVDGPYLALSADGSVCVWRTEGALARDAWTASVAPVPSPPQTVTADPQFVDTLDEVGLAGAFAIASQRAIVLAVGERADPLFGGVEGLDFYLVKTPAGGGAPVITNITLTSGDTVQPFTKGAIDPTRGAYRIPGEPRLIVRDDAGSGGRVSVVDLAAATVTPIVLGAEEVRSIERHGSRYLMTVERDLAGPLTHDLVIADVATLSSTTLASIAATNGDFDRLTVRADGWAGVGVRIGLDEFAARVHVPTGFGELIVPFGFDLGPTLAWTAGGRLALTGALPGGPSIPIGWGLGVPWYAVPIVPQDCFVLP